MKRCMYCGHENGDEAETCVKCGNRLLDMPNEESDSLEEIPDELGAGPEASRELPEIKIAEPEIGDTQEQGHDAGAPAAHDEEGTGAEEASDAASPEDAGSTDGAADTGVDETPSAPAGEAPAAEDEVPEGEAGGIFEEPPVYGGQDYTYQAQEGGQTRSGGQGYGYEDAPQEHAAYEDEYDDYDDYSAGPLLFKSRKRIKSFLFFLAALLYTVKTVAMIVNAVTGNMEVTVKSMTANLNYFFGRDVAVITENINNAMTQADNLTKGKELWVLGGSLLPCLPALLITLGLWMAFASISNKKDDVSTAGLTLIRVIEIFEMIFTCIGLAGAIVLSVAFVVAAGASSSTMSLILGIVGLLIVIIAAVLVILYYVQLIFAIRVVRRNAKTGDDIGKIPGYLIFVGILGAAVTGALMIPMSPDDYLGLVLFGATAAWLLVISIWAIVYRATVKVR